MRLSSDAFHRLCVPFLAALALAGGCDKDNSLGEVADTDGGSGSGGAESQTSGSGSQTSAGSVSESGSGETGETTTGATGETTTGATGGTSETGNECPPNSVMPQPAECLAGDAPVFGGEPGCYELCAEEGVDCGGGGTCMRVQINPCPCDENAKVCCDACGGEELLCMPEAFDVACASIVGRTFRSVEELECGLTPEGPALCHWMVSFGFDETFMWMHSDVGEAGSYTCTDGVVTTDGSASGIYDPESTILTWDGVEYAPSP